MLRLEPRAVPSRGWAWASPVVAVLLTALIGALLFSALGKDPLQSLATFFWEPIKSRYALTELAVKATPLILCALGLALCFRANVWNIGAEGQFLAGAMGGGWLAIQLGPQAGQGWLALVLLAGIAGGMAWAAITALLRDRFNANEILVSLMLVYVAQQLLNYLVFGPWKDPMAFNFPQTKMFEPAASLPLLLEGSRLHLGFALALLLVPVVWLFMQRSYAGFQMQVGGLAPLAARYAGFSSRAALWTALLVSGGFAGLAGVVEATGPLKQLTPHVSVGYGFAAIIVAFVGRLHPVGVVLAALLMSMFYIGGELAQSRLGLPAALTGIFQGLLLICLLACDTLIHSRLRWVGIGGSSARTLSGQK
jgi:simple sugar transport system permease protein